MFGAFDLFEGIKGSNNKQSNDPNSPYYAGGSYNKSYNEIGSRAKNLFRQASRAVPIVGPDASGFMPYQRAGMNEFARNLFSSGSSAAAARGMQMPENYGAVVGSALTRALPGLFAIQNENQFIPTKIANERMDIMKPLLMAGSTSLGPGVGYNNLDAANKQYWQMMQNIGSFWGGGGMKGAALKGGQSGGSYFGGVA